MSRDIVSAEDWRKARLALLAREKELTRAREELAQARRALPWVKIEKPYTFDSTRGQLDFAGLFDGCTQLIVYHFMFGPDWQQGCPSCSFWADNYNGALPHLRARDINLVAVSRAPLAVLQDYRARMGWSFDWLSSASCDFNFDFAVSFAEGEKTAPNYNFGTQVFNADEAPGISVFYREGDEIYHTYSCYARGLDMVNGAYQMMDLLPKGRDESELPWPMAWVRRHDEYS